MTPEITIRDAHIEQLEKALKFYADTDNYFKDIGTHGFASSKIERDGGEIVNKALGYFSEEDEFITQWRALPEKDVIAYVLEVLGI